MTEAMIAILEMLLAEPEPLTAFAISRRMPMDLGRVQKALDEGIAYDLIIMAEAVGALAGPFIRYRAKTLEDRQKENAFFSEQLEMVRRGTEEQMRDELAAKLDKPSLVPPKNRLLDGWGDWRTEPKK